MKSSDLLRERFVSDEPPRSLFPLLWLHGAPEETEEALRREIRAMEEGGCGGFVIESRPHADYLGEGWWRDVGICLDEARRLGMDVWMFDEEYYPSGIAGGKVLERMPDYRMQVLTKTSFLWSAEGEEPEAMPLDGELFKIVCVPEERGERAAFAQWTEWQAWARERREAGEAASWTVHVIGVKPSWSGRMFDKMVDYLSPEVTDCFIELTYEATKRRFPEYWGTTLKGFFGDETSFENFGSYDVLFGEETPCFPWPSSVRHTFEQRCGYDLYGCVEALWLDEDEENTASFRTDFMDHLTKLFSENFFARIQRWCHANGVRFIGHVVEDNRAHMNHGFGVGHFFRTTKHFDMGGYDFVLRQVDSEQKSSSYEEHFPQFKTYRDRPYPDFFHYTLAKLAQSAAHLEVGTSLVMCENFGAYGWDLGLREMKWLTDWMTARGTNWYVPHAFSPIFPDPDCPPHFYAGGRNPQWPYFRQWGDYANRSCLMLREARHVAPIAVLYPAEAHWGGDENELDGVCKVLMQSQYDFDILSMDLLVDEDRCEIGGGTLRIRDERFSVVVLPGIVRLPASVRERLKAFIRSGGKVVSVNRAAVEGGEPVGLDELAERLSHWLAPGVGTTKPFPELRFCHYEKSGLQIFFLNNESVEETFEDIVAFPADGVAERWTPMDGKIEKLPLYDRAGDRIRAPIRLEPYESCFIIVDPDGDGHGGSAAELGLSTDEWHRAQRTEDGNLHLKIRIGERRVEEWRATAVRSSLLEAPAPDSARLSGLGDWGRMEGMEAFCGSVDYEASFELDSLKESYALDLGEVGEIAALAVNGQELSPRLCPPYRWVLPPEALKSGENRLRVTVTNTLGPYFREDDFRRDVPAPAGLIGPVTLTAWESRAAFEERKGFA